MTSSNKFNEEEDWSFEFVQPDQSYIQVQQQKPTKLQKKIDKIENSNNDEVIELENMKKSIEVHENNMFEENNHFDEKGHTHSENDKGKTTIKSTT